MQRFSLWRRYIKLMVVLIAVPYASVFATEYVVTLTTDANPLGGGNSGDLRNALTQLAVTGTSGESAANNTIYLQVANGSTINVGASGANWPVITNGVTICYSTDGATCASSGSGQITVSGATSALPTTPSANLFATATASLTLTNLSLAYGLAQGGSGASVSAGGGGGGGLGAGGGIYIDAGEQLTLSNVAIGNCNVIGGAGGAGGSASASLAGGGGGASWSNADADANGGTGGGANPGSNPDPTLTTVTVLSGYGGGSGGTGSTGSAGLGGGNSFGQPNASGGTSTSGGAGGYCGGGGGSGPNGGGGGGGNPGGYGNVVSGSTGGGAGGGFGSGGGGGSESAGINSASGGGGGGGFGGGGGGAGGTNLLSAGGGGGGFGGGGGGGGVSAGSGGFGGNFGGDGDASVQAAAGGGGGAVGGAIFVGDAATLIINDSVSIPTASSSVTGGVSGGGSATDGQAYATDIFLFQNAQLQFTGTNGYPSGNPFATAIQADTTGGAVLDDGVLINTTTNSTVITLSSILNNYQGGTNIQQGILSVGATNLPTTGDINIQANGTLYLTSAYTPTVAITNAGALNVTSGAFTIPASFTNSGNLYVIDTGSIVGTITSGSSLNIGQTSTNVTGANAFNSTSPITVTSVNVYNTSSLVTAGGSVSANLYMLGTSTYSGANISGGQLTIGIDSFGSIDATTAFTAAQAISNTDFPIINVNTGSFSNNGFNITPTSVNVYNTSTLTSTGGGVITANLYMLGASTFSGANISGTTLTIGADSFGSQNTSTSFAAQQAISGFPSIIISAGQFSTNGFAVSNVNTAFTIASGAQAIFDAVVSGTAPLTINGTLTNSVNNGVGLTGLITNNGTFNINQPLTLSNTINSAGTIAIATGINFTSSSDMYLYNSASVSGNVNGGGASSITIGQDSLANTYSSSDVTISATLTGIPTLSVNFGSLTASGAISGLTNSLNVASGASASFGSSITGDPIATNAGTLITYAPLNLASYTSTGTTSFVITDAITVGQIIATGAVSLGSTGITVSSNFLTAVAGNTYTWTLVNGTSVSPNPVNYSIPTDTVANTWTLSQAATSISVQLVKGSLNPNNPVIGPVIHAISLNPANLQQFYLVDALGNALTQDDLDNFVNELIPDLNSAIINVRKQDAIFTQIWQRVNAIRTNVAMHNSYGVAAGDISRNKSAWLGGFVSSANQNPYDNNFGYRAYSGGGILGLDTMLGERDLIGIAFARSSTNIETKLDPGLNTRTIGYHVLAYGNHDFGQYYNYFVEWMLSTAYNENTGNKRILITNNNFSTQSQYHDWQGGVLFNYGKVFRYNSCVNINPKASMQYNFIDIPAYDESAQSPAALHVANNRWRDTLTLGVGGELAFQVNKKYFVGRPSITGILAYDVISTKEITTANFLYGGGAFTYIGAPKRLSVNLGLDCTFAMNTYTELQFLYELQLRSGYIANSGTAKLRIFF